MCSDIICFHLNCSLTHVPRLPVIKLHVGHSVTFAFPKHNGKGRNPNIKADSDIDLRKLFFMYTVQRRRLLLLYVIPFQYGQIYSIFQFGYLVIVFPQPGDYL